MLPLVVVLFIRLVFLFSLYRGRYKGGYTSYDDPNALCGIVFVENKFVAKLLYHFLKDLSRNDDAYSFIMPQYATDLDDEDLDGYDMEVFSTFMIIFVFARFYLYSDSHHLRFYFKIQVST